MDRMEIDFQIVIRRRWLGVRSRKQRVAAAVCRAYNNYIAEQCAKAPKAPGGVVWCYSDPPPRSMKLSAPCQKLGQRVVIPGIAGNTPLHAKQYVPFFETMNDLDAPVGFHAVTGSTTRPGRTASPTFSRRM